MSPPDPSEGDDAVAVPEAGAFSFPLADVAPSGFAFHRIWRHPGCPRFPIVHPGVDFHGPTIGGTPVLAVTDGLVVYVAPDLDGDGHPDAWGGVVVEHSEAGMTFFSQYGHVDLVRVHVGDVVPRGAPIAVVGEIGRVVHTPHLHFEIRTSSHPDPRNGSFWSCRGFASKRRVRTWYRDPVRFLLERGAELPAPRG